MCFRLVSLNMTEDQECLSLIVVPHLNSSVDDKEREKEGERFNNERVRAILGIFRSNACITYTEVEYDC